MAKQTLRAITRLLKLDLHRLGGWNEFVHSRNPKTRRRWLGLAFLWLFLLAMAVFYLVMMAMGMAAYGLADLLPGCLYTGTAVALLVFETLRAGAFLFSADFRDGTAPLPMPSVALPLSRLLELYLCDLTLCALLLGPGLVIYSMAHTDVGTGYWATALWGLLLAPLLPMALACLLGAMTAFLVRGMRHKNLISGLLLVAFTMAVLAWSMSLTTLPADTDGADLMAMLRPALTAAASGYPPAHWFGRMLSGGPGSLAALGWLSLVSLLPAVLAAGVVTANYTSLCAALHSPAGRRHTAREAGVHSPLTALYLREARRYTACASWLANTVVGYLLMAAFPLLLLFGGTRLMESLDLTPEAAGRYLPVILGLLAVLMPVTACSVSLEGTQWPLVRTLPVSNRNLLLAKILLNLTVALPCWAVAAVGGLLAVRPRGTAALWLFLVPGLYCLFGAVAALRINLAFPRLHWQTETQVVKQSTSSLLAMLAGFAAAGIPGLCLLFLPETIVYAVLSCLLVALTLLLWRGCLRVDLQKIQ